MMYFERKIIENNNTMQVTIPKDIINYMKLSKNHKAKITILNENSITISFEVCDDAEQV